MAYTDEYTLASNATFQQRCLSALLDYIRVTIAGITNSGEVSYDIQTISCSGTPTGGTFTLSGGPLNGTIGLPYNATPSQVGALLQAGLPSGGLAACLGTPLPSGSVEVVWYGSLAQSPQNLMTANSSGLTGGTTPTISVAHTVTGVAQPGHPLHVAFAQKVLAAPSSYLTIISYAVAGDANIQSDYLGRHSRYGNAGHGCTRPECRYGSLQHAVRCNLRA